MSGPYFNNTYFIYNTYWVTIFILSCIFDGLGAIVTPIVVRSFGALCFLWNQLYRVIVVVLVSVGVALVCLYAYEIVDWFSEAILSLLTANYSFDLVEILQSLKTSFPTPRDFVDWALRYLSTYVKCAPPESFLLYWRFSESRYCSLYNHWYSVPVKISRFDNIIFCTLIIMFSLLTWFLTAATIQLRIQEIAMRFIDCLASTYHLRSDVLRPQFMDSNLSKFKVQEHHTHGVSAADRSKGSNFCNDYAKSLGLTPYYIQMSASDQRKGREGSRTYFWPKDFNAQQVEFQQKDSYANIMIDVDQYMDMPSFLADNFLPTIIYTFQPEKVARISKEYNYTFDIENRVRYTVTGGATYEHEVWNYGLDSVLVTKSCFGIVYKAATYLVDRRHTSDDHDLVLMTPLRHWSGPAAFFVNMFIKAQPLIRLKPHQNGFLRMEIVSPGGVSISTGIAGSHIEITTLKSVDDAIASIARTSKHDIVMAQITSITDDKLGSAPLLEFYRNTVPEKPPVVFPVEEAIRRYQFEPKNFDPDARPSMVPFMSPLMHECFAPDQTKSNEETAVLGRVLEIKAPELPMTPLIDGYFTEFITYLIPHEHKLHPVPVEEVWERQNRPTQRAILDQSDLTLGKIDQTVKTFLKKEPYPDVKDPRIISTVNGVDKREYSTFIYSLVDNVLSQQKWYAFCKSPKEVEEIIVNLCEQAITDVTLTDFARYDGHKSNLIREFQRRVLLRAFRTEYHSKLIESHKAHYLKKAVMTMGTKYETGYSQLSGAADTAAFNSIENAMIAYVAWRRTGLTPDEAWKRVVDGGGYGGDDGVTADIDTKVYVASAAMLGHKLKAEPIARGQPGVMFLARVYSPYVWEGDRNNCCDIPRQLGKFHATVSLNTKATPCDKLLEKARSFYLTDCNTPIIGPFVTRVVMLNGGEIEMTDKTAAMRAWNSWIDKDNQYTNVFDSWMLDYLHRVLPNLDQKMFSTWLESCNNLNDMLRPPLLQEPKQPVASRPVVVDGGDTTLFPEKKSNKGKEPEDVKSGGKSLEPAKPMERKSEVKQDKPVKGTEEYRIWFEKMRAQKQAEGTWVEKPRPEKK